MKTTKKKNTVASTSAKKKSTAPRRTGKQAPSKKEKPMPQDQEFPGYPHYDPNEDITRKQVRLDTNLDDDTLTDERQVRKDDAPLKLSDNQAGETTGAGVFDVNEEDLEALGPKDLSLDGNEDEQLKHRTQPVDFSGEDLDVPGSELDDAQEAKGSEDEENNVYSLGGK